LQPLLQKREGYISMGRPYCFDSKNGVNLSTVEGYSDLGLVIFLVKHITRALGVGGAFLSADYM